MEVVLVAALDENGIIGKDGALPWRLPADLARFKKITVGRPVVMGRRTWESIGRPLPKRINIVLSRDPEFRAEGAVVVADPADALAAAERSGATELMVIGGAEVYSLFLPLARRLELTRIHGKFIGDTRFPAFDPASFREERSEARPADDANPQAMTFITLVRA